VPTVFAVAIVVGIVKKSFLWGIGGLIGAYVICLAAGFLTLLLYSLGKFIDTKKSQRRRRKELEA